MSVAAAKLNAAVKQLDRDCEASYIAKVRSSSCLDTDLRESAALAHAFTLALRHLHIRPHIEGGCESVVNLHL